MNFIVETPEGKFEYLEWRYANSRYQDPSHKWAKLYETYGNVFWGYSRLIKER